MFVCLSGVTRAHLSALCLIVGLTALPVVSQAETVNVYSYRQPFLVKPLFDAFTRQTGIDVKVVFAKKGPVSYTHLTLPTKLEV